MAGNPVTFGQDRLCGFKVFGVDWINVDYFDATAGGHVVKLSSFQLILIDRSDTGPGNFDIEFNYNTITWETGDASGGTNGLGGTSARVGFSNGTGNPGTNFELPGSGINGAFLDGGPNALASHSALATTPGRIHFLVRNGMIVQAPGTHAIDITSDLRLFYPFRYVFTHQGNGNHTYTGRFTFLRRGGAAQQLNGNACLDEIATSNINVFGPPITLVFRVLPPGVTVVNPTGFTASGLPFITVQQALPAPGSRFRVQLRFHNPRAVHLSTFFLGFPIEVFAGPFDPTVV
jgi:hypothetical protein